MMREQKDSFVTQMKNDIEKSMAVLLVDYTGLTVAEERQLRKKLRESQVGYKVVKNTLMKRAVANTPYEGVSKFLKGTPTGVILGFGDPIVAAKHTVEFLKECEHLKIKGGIFDNKAITAKEVEALSKFPSRGELIAGILGMILGTGRTLAAQIKAPGGKLVGAIDAKAKDAENK